MNDDIPPQQSKNVWDRMENEPALWYSRFTRFRLMFPRRSVSAVYDQEQMMQSQKTEKDGKRRGMVTGLWYDAAKQWKWEERAEAWDAVQFAEEEKTRQRVMQSGYALQHNRILALQEKITEFLEMARDEDKVWIPDVKAIGNGPGAERVDLVQFNAPLFTLIDKYLGSIAAEMGERKNKAEVTGKDGGKIEFEVDWGGGSIADEKES